MVQRVQMEEVGQCLLALSGHLLMCLEFQPLPLKVMTVCDSLYQSVRLRDTSTTPVLCTLLWKRSPCFLSSVFNPVTGLTGKNTLSALSVYFVKSKKKR